MTKKKYSINVIDAEEMTIGNVKLKLVKDRDTDEWVVQVYINGQYKEGPTYYTDDRQDAIYTMKAMAEHYRKQQKLDSHQLKTYKIKNHDSGQTYRVKAVSYADAKMKYNEHILKDSITEDAYVYPTHASTAMAASFAKLCVEKFGGKVGSKGGNKYVYIAQDKETANKAKQFLEEKYKTSLPTVEFIVADSITEDADKVMGTYKGYTIKQNVDGDIYVLKKSGEKEFFESWKKAYEAIKAGAIKDSITEDAYAIVASTSFWSTRTEKGATAGRIADILLKVRDHLTHFKNKLSADEQWEAMFPKYVEAGKKFGLNAEALSKAVDFIKTGKGNPWKDSITEDADIAQNDIKSSYLPEDANADNIQYLGFNEKRKLSFYGYGDRYFVHYDLEGRTEEIDKATVQKILKKNILGEIDENDLINKEPQSEEIVSDAFEDIQIMNDLKKKQERGDR